VAHLDRAPACLSNNSKSFGQDLVEGGLFGGLDLDGVSKPLQPGGDGGTELDGLVPQLLVSERLDLRFQFVDGCHNGPKPLEHTVIRGTKNPGKYFIKKHRNLRLPV